MSNGSPSAAETKKVWLSPLPAHAAPKPLALAPVEPPEASGVASGVASEVAEPDADGSLDAVPAGVVADDATVALAVPVSGGSEFGAVGFVEPQAPTAKTTIAAQPSKLEKRVRFTGSPLSNLKSLDCDGNAAARGFTPGRSAGR